MVPGPAGAESDSPGLAPRSPSDGGANPGMAGLSIPPPWKGGIVSIDPGVALSDGRHVHPDAPTARGRILAQMQDLCGTQDR